MKQTDVDIIVAGGGIAGLIATLACAQAGYRVICADPNTPITSPSDGADYRATALLQPAVALLNKIGVWYKLADYACPLSDMRIIDIGGDDYQIRYDARFNGAEIGVKDFGQNVINWRLSKQLMDLIAQNPNTEFLSGYAIQSSHAQSDFIDVRLNDETRRAKLLIAADGRHSPTRDAAGIGVTTWRYGQRALSFVVAHRGDHENCSVELHRSGGPCTFVPLPNQTGEHISSVVWMCDAADADRIANLPSAQFITALEKRSAHIFGDLSLRSPITQWPIISQYAQRLTGTRLALLAEAAHVVPPIGAQGLNMSLADIAALIDSMAQHPIGSIKQLSAYQRARRGDIITRVHGIDALNRAAQTDVKLFKALRMKGLRALHQITPLRTRIMRMGLGQS